MMEKNGQRRSLSLARKIYIFAVSVVLLRYLVLPFFYTEPYYAPKWFLVIQFAIAAAGIILGKMWREKAFWPMAAYCLLILIRVLFVAAIPVLWDSVVSQIFFHGLWVTGACFSVASILDQHQIKSFFRFMAAAWTILSVLHCLIALYAAWIGKDIWNITRGAFWGLAATNGAGGPGFAEQNAVGAGVNVRLNVIYYCTVSGAMTSLSAMIALCAAICEKRKTVKVLYCLALLPFAFAMGLTDTRACHVSFAAGAGSVAGMMILRAFSAHDLRGKPEKPIQTFRKVIWWLAALSSALAVMVILIWCIGSTTQLFNLMKAKGSLIVNKALAEESAAATVVSVRGYSGSLNSVLSDRLTIWEYVLRYLFSNPISLLSGESISNPMTGPNSQNVLYEAGHPHNALLMVLLESGIPGLLLILTVLLTTVRRSFRLIVKLDTPLWLVLLNAVALSVCVGDFVECIAGFLGYPYPNCSILFLCIGAICFYGRISPDTKTASI